MVAPRACVACLGSVALRLVDMTASHSLHYNLLTGLQLYSDESLPRHLCYECAALLGRTIRFRDKCHRSYRLMKEILSTKLELSHNDILKINREDNLLATSLTTCQLASVDYPPSEDHVKTETECDTLNDNGDPDFVYPADFDDSADMFLSECKLEDTLKTENSQLGSVDNVFVDVKEEERHCNEPDTFDSDKKASAKRGRKKLAVAKESALDEKAGRKKSIAKLGKVRKEVKCKTAKKLPKVAKRTQKVAKKPSDGRKIIYTDEFYESFATVTVHTLEEQLVELNQRKDSDNYKNSPYRCENCYKGFLEPVSYTNHMHMHDPKLKGPYECDVCKKRFWTTRLRRKHVKNHSKSYACKLCSHVTHSDFVARQHYDIHIGVKYQCKHCNKKFPTSTARMTHLRKEHPSTYVCSLCGYCFVSDKGLVMHRKKIHLVDGDDSDITKSGPRCAACEITFANQQAYDKHLKTSGNHVRSGESAQYMEQRGKSRQVTKKKAKEKQPIACEQCGLEVANFREYNRHFRSQHKDKNRTQFPATVHAPYICETCGSVFATSLSLRHHRTTHTGEAIVKPYKCNDCGKMFKYTSTLYEHSRRHGHTKHQYFQCEVCEKEFSTKSNLQRHLAIHSDAKPLSCDYCEKTFKYSDCKKAHEDHVHRGIPWPKRKRAKNMNADGTDITC